MPRLRQRTWRQAMSTPGGSVAVLQAPTQRITAAVSATAIVSVGGCKG
ncbi:MAG: hypothetical protein QM721_05525 [Micropruina sp.]